MLNLLLFATLSVLPSTTDTPTDLAYYEGHWTCQGSQSGKSGTLTVDHKLADLFYEFTWEGKAQGTETPAKTVTYASWNANAKRYTRNGFNNDGSRIHLVSNGFENDTIVWAGEVDVRGGGRVYIRITEKKTDASSYTTTYETSEEGKDYTERDTGTCKRI